MLYKYETRNKETTKDEDKETNEDQVIKETQVIEKSKRKTRAKEREERVQNGKNQEDVDKKKVIKENISKEQLKEKPNKQSKEKLSRRDNKRKRQRRKRKRKEKRKAIDRRNELYKLYQEEEKATREANVQEKADDRVHILLFAWIPEFGNEFTNATNFKTLSVILRTVKLYTQLVNLRYRGFSTSLIPGYGKFDKFQIFTEENFVTTGLCF